MIIACALAVAGMLASSPGTARADGDPASDVLATQALFLPQDAAIAVPQQLELEALLQAAGRAGYPIRVALIASPTDLGSITELWAQPVQYAKFLGQELSLAYRGLLLVVMPAGFGLYDQGRSTAAEQAALAGIAVHRPGPLLAAPALAAIRRLAAAAGHPLALTRVQTPSASRKASNVPWIVFGLGIALIAAAWAASLRVRPLRQPRSA